MAIDPFLRHEALDRASLCADFIESTLAYHPGFTETEQKEIEKIVDKLNDLYLKIGAEE